MSPSDFFEYSTADDPSLNYCLWPYSPVAPVEDKFRAINILLHSFAHAGLDESAHRFVEAVRDAVGPFKTVFGIKEAAGELAWEFYFYDYARQDREISINQTPVTLIR